MTKTTTIRVYQDDMERFRELQRQLTMAAKGQPVSQPEAFKWLLDTEASKGK